MVAGLTGCTVDGTGHAPGTRPVGNGYLRVGGLQSEGDVQAVYWESVEPGQILTGDDSIRALVIRDPELIARCGAPTVVNSDERMLPSSEPPRRRREITMAIRCPNRSPQRISGANAPEIR
ncbi:hypothetical protein GXW71_05065 [Roseomonas hellenica]|uniref:Uncharacterized protein n=1 Tax=Plastoroseomonas hellenica TaxID=2687306 RepID=A0ABS5ETV2_9PROT|nr:hypothetical protein [Plastoroseomonas hellenica]MBR0663723.1 hypothetical protein [Plastoroseomonas hellenica]